MKHLANSRHDPLIWCGLCFLISFMGFWLPPLAEKFVTPYDNPGGGVIWIFTGPFVVAAGIRSYFAFRKLNATSSQDGQTGWSGLMFTLGFILTLGVILPAIICLFIDISMCFMFFHHL